MPHLQFIYFMLHMIFKHIIFKTQQEQNNRVLLHKFKTIGVIR